MAKTMKTVTANIAIGSEERMLAPLGVKGWFGVFPLASAALFATQLPAAAAICLTASLAVTMAAIAHISVKDADNDGRFDAKQQVIGLLAPAQFALLIWLAVMAGSALTSSFAASCVVAFAVFAVFFALEFLASAAALFLLERNEGISGLSLAGLISGKYSGLLGRLV